MTAGRRQPPAWLRRLPRPSRLRLLRLHAQRRIAERRLAAARRSLRLALTGGEDAALMVATSQWHLARGDLADALEAIADEAIRRRAIAMMVVGALVFFGATTAIIIADNTRIATRFTITAEVSHVDFALAENWWSANLLAATRVDLDRVSRLTIGGTVSGPRLDDTFKDGASVAVRAPTHVRVLFLPSPGRIKVSNLSQSPRSPARVEAIEIAYARGGATPTAPPYIDLIATNPGEIGTPSGATPIEVGASLVSASDGSFTAIFFTKDPWEVGISVGRMILLDPNGRSSVRQGTVSVDRYARTFTLQPEDRLEVVTADESFVARLTFDDGMLSVRQEVGASQLSVHRGGEAIELVPTLFDWIVLKVGKISTLWPAGAAIFAVLIWAVTNFLLRRSTGWRL